MEAQHQRRLKEGTAYNALIAASTNRDKLIAKQAGVPDTLALVRRVASEYHQEVSKLAEHLAVRKQGQLDVAATCRALWQFVYEHIQYHLDEPGLEQVRHPARSWADRVRGVDCEDYAVLLSACLLNLHVPHLLRISAYKGGWQHIYVIVPTSAAALAQLPTEPFTEDYKKSPADKPRLLRRDYITLDCVTDEYNFEVAPSKTMNLVMPQLFELSGFELSPAALESEAGPLSDSLLVASYPSISGHTIGIGDLGGLYVRDEGDMGDLGELGELGAIGRFKPYPHVRRALQKQKRPISRKAKPGHAIKRLVGDGGLYRNPAEILGATDIAAAWRTESNHYVGMDSLGSLYVLDENDQIERLGELSGFDVNDPELAGWLKNAFKKVGNVYAAAGKGIVKAGSFVGKNVAKGVQKGVFDNLNKIPGVKYVADHYGKEILQAGAGLALSAVTGGAAAPALLALKAAKAGSIAAKVGKAASLANKARQAVQMASKAKKVVQVANLVNKAKKVVMVAKKASALLPRGAQVGAAMTLSENPNPLSFMPADTDQVQDFAPTPLNLVQRLYAPAPAYRGPGPRIPLSPETSPYADESDLPVRPTASVVEPTEAVYDAPGYAAPDETATYAVAYEEPAPAAADYGVAPYDDYAPAPAYDDYAPSEEVGSLGALGLPTPGVLAAGGLVLGLGIAAIIYGSKNQPPPHRRTNTLTGLPAKRRKRPTKAGGKAGGKSRIIRL